MRNYLILREKVLAFRADPAVHAALEAAEVAELRPPTLADGESLADLRAASYDVEALAERSVAMEALDQLAMEHLIGRPLTDRLDTEPGRRRTRRAHRWTHCSTHRWQGPNARGPAPDPMERTVTTEGIVMNTLITRLQRRSRLVVGSTMAVIVSLPLGAAIGLAPASSAAVPSPATERASTTSDDSTKAPDASVKKSKKSTSSTLGEAVPWTADPEASAQAAPTPSTRSSSPRPRRSGTARSTRRPPPSSSSAPTTTSP